MQKRDPDSLSNMSGKRANETDRSNGWEAVANDFIGSRAQSSVGAATVRAWAQSLPSGASVLDLGCGFGVPISEVLIASGFVVYGVDASPTSCAEFRRRFPEARVACEAVEDSAFFNRTFDAVIAWGLLFLLPPATQRELIQRVARVLVPGGRFLFTAPTQTATWNDLSTGRLSESLGFAAYSAELTKAGLTLVSEYVDEGENHYYDAVRK